MKPETTHRLDPATGCYRQLVSATRLRAILDDEGSTYDRPFFLTDDDEWMCEPPYEPTKDA